MLKDEEIKELADRIVEEKWMVRKREYQREYYRTHREQVLAYNREYSRTHREKILERQRVWREKNRDRINEQQRRRRIERRKENDACNGGDVAAGRDMLSEV